MKATQTILMGVVVAALLAGCSEDENTNSPTANDLGPPADLGPPPDQIVYYMDLGRPDASPCAGQFRGKGKPSDAGVNYFCLP